MTTERAPEPTMDEILASIKRIIADEDEGASGRGNGGVTGSMTHKHDGLKPFSESDEGDEQLIDDIARALNNAGNEGIAEDDDILDLTRVMTEQIEAEAAVEPKSANAAMDDPFELGSALRDPPGGAFSREPQGEHNFADDDIFSLDNELSDEVREVGKADDREQPAHTETNAGVFEFGRASDSGDAWTLTSATGDQPSADVFELPRKEPAFGEQADDAGIESRSGAELLSDAEMLPDAETLPDPAERIDPEETFSSAVSESVPGDLNPAPASNALWELPSDENDAPVVAPMTPVEAASEPVPAAQLPAAQIIAAPMAESSGAPASALLSGMSMEDSVKEMLRPMLREWLNENMPRILESALRDELQRGSLPDA